MGKKFIRANDLHNCDSIRINIGDHLTGEATEDARLMLDDSEKFLNELSSSRQRGQDSQWTIGEGVLGNHLPLRPHGPHCARFG
jgi:hypothetical protein